MERDDDLLQPTLSERDDLAGIDRPWTPSSLVFTVFFAGPLAGGYLVALNHRRLGMPERFAPTLWIFVALALVNTMALFTLLHFGVLDRDDAEQRRVTRFAGNLAAVLLTLGMIAPQKRRFELWEAHGNEPASLWLPGLIAVGVGIVATFALVFVVRLGWIAIMGQPR